MANDPFVALKEALRLSPNMILFTLVLGMLALSSIAAMILMIGPRGAQPFVGLFYACATTFLIGIIRCQFVANFRIAGRVRR